MLDVLSCHIRNVLFILFACDIEDYLEYFILQSHIPMFARISYKLLY